MAGYKYFTPLLHSYVLRQEFKSALELADHDLKEITDDSELFDTASLHINDDTTSYTYSSRNDLYAYISGEKYPFLMDMWLEWGQWSDIETQHLINGFAPCEEISKVILPEEIFYPLYMYFLPSPDEEKTINNLLDNDTDNDDKKNYLQNSTIRIDGLTDSIIRDICFVIKKYVSDKELAQQMIHEISMNTNTIDHNRSCIHTDFDKHLSNIANFDNPNDATNHLIRLRSIANKPLWLESVLKKNLTLFKINKVDKIDANVDKNTEKRLAYLDKWLIEHGLIGGLPKEQGYTRKKIYEELTNRAFATFESKTTDQLENNIKSLFKAARERELCFFNKKPD